MSDLSPILQSVLPILALDLQVAHLVCHGVCVCVFITLIITSCQTHLRIRTSSCPNSYGLTCDRRVDNMPQVFFPVLLLVCVCASHPIPHPATCVSIGCALTAAAGQHQGYSWIH